MGHLCSSAHPFNLGCRVDYVWTDPCLFPTPPFIFLALTFMEAFQRNTPLAINFLKWSHREKARAVGVHMCGIYKWAKQSFIFPQIFFYCTCLTLLCFLFPTLVPKPFLSSSPCTLPPQGCCSAFWISTPAWCVRIVTRLALKTACTDSSTRGSHPAPQPTFRSPVGILGHCL